MGRPTSRQPGSDPMSQDQHATIATCPCCGDRFIPDDGPCCLKCEECGDVSESVKESGDGRELCEDCTPDDEECEWCGQPLNDGQPLRHGLHEDCFDDAKAEAVTDRDRDDRLTGDLP